MTVEVVPEPCFCGLSGWLQRSCGAQIHLLWAAAKLMVAAKAWSGRIVRGGDGRHHLQRWCGLGAAPWWSPARLASGTMAEYCLKPVLAGEPHRVGP